MVLFGADTTHNQWVRTVGELTNERTFMGATVLRDVNGQDLRCGFMIVTRSNVEKVQPNYDLYAGRRTQVAPPR